MRVTQVTASNLKKARNGRWKQTIVANMRYVQYKRNQQNEVQRELGRSYIAAIATRIEPKSRTPENVSTNVEGKSGVQMPDS